MPDNFRVKLTKDLWLYEFLVSDKAARLGRAIIPDAVVIANITRLCESVLQPVRDKIGTPIVISSGYRPLWLNKAVGGSLTSAHMDGRAADCKAIGMTPLALCQATAKLDIPYDQIIYEFGAWMHVGIANGKAKPRRQLLTAKRIGGKVKYLPGLIA